MRFIQCTFDEHAPAILDLFNDAIENTTALYEYKPRTLQTMVEWFENKAKHDFPVIGAVDAEGELMGFASYGWFRPFPANKYTVEHSVYVHEDHQGKGLGQALLNQVISAAKAQQYHTIIGGIDMANAGSIYLHEKLGFTHSGTIKQAGFKFGQWLDLGFYQMILPTPKEPKDG